MYRAVMLALAAVGLTACFGNDSGHINSTKDGDRSHLAERKSPLEDLRAPCGDGAPTAYGASAMKRQPYLQQMTTTDVKLGWVSAGVGEHVTVTMPDGTAVESQP